MKHTVKWKTKKQNSKGRYVLIADVRILQKQLNMKKMIQTVITMLKIQCWILKI